METEGLDVDPETGLATEFDDIFCSEHVFDIQFHPSEPVIAASIITGVVEFHQFDAQEGGNDLIATLQNHEESCRTLRFFPSGDHLISGSADRFCMVVDRAGAKVWKSKLHSAGVNSLLVLDEHTFAAGDDEGQIKLWDVRQPKSVFQINENDDFISDMQIANDKKSLVVTSGDGTLAVYDLRAKGDLVAMSDPQEDEFLSCLLMHDGQKVVCGTQLGVLGIFSWGDFGDVSDRLVGHPSSVDAMVKLNEMTAATGSSDGVIRIVNFFPNMIVGILGEHSSEGEEGGVLVEGQDSFPIEKMALDASGQLLASCSHDQLIKFWPTAPAYRMAALALGSADDEHGGLTGDGGLLPSEAAAAAAASSSSSSSAAAAAAMPRGGRQANSAAFRQQNFFSDL
uniref:Uncharacterized protein n=1 Tax=Chromera velia CCMP2878 TaxID=1169474 RepID=A0A0G4HX61_9ALVE|eukprot:Cvel_9208.t1-p1 / transcript=Cvel_9208.t1 / gene=Cvel_9208 / organism=Chromera_velia_CCMP2878 / gene_product=WD repeat-containing protein 55, putative / transcript_product=WD repeat-containing protein 55, putative / location=Cvel_scaffold525:5011-6198(-) / protein_length=396 / sequence_SO=supercontig / SO=protein_coding / is_pseudo=false